MASVPKLALQLPAGEYSVSAEAMESSSNGGSVARRRHQHGYVYLDGLKWKGRYCEDIITAAGTKRIRREVILGTRKRTADSLAERQMEIVLARINEFDYRPGRVATFAEFLESGKPKCSPSSNRLPHVP